MWPESLHAQWKDPAYRAMRIAKRQVAMARIRAGEGFMYLAEVAGTNVIKIGFSLNPEIRVKAAYSLQPNTRLRLLASFPASLPTEQALHRILGDEARTGYGSEYYFRSVLRHPAVPSEFRRFRSMTTLGMLKAREACGGRDIHIAKLLGISPAAVSRWNGLVPPNRAIEIETKTDKKVTRYEIRPDYFGVAPASASEAA